MKLCGCNNSYKFGGCLNNYNDDTNNIKFPGQSCLDVSSLLSFSSYVSSVWINQNYEAFAVGNNEFGQINSALPKEILEIDTKINFRYKNGQPCKFISAVGGHNYTLFQISGETSSDPSLLALAYAVRKTIFLNIGKRSPLSLFGGVTVSAAIDTDGSVIIITESVYDSPESEIEIAKLPPGEKAVKAACGKKSVIVLCESCRVFECSLTSKTNNNTFSEVKELAGKKINEISGTCDHFFAISEDCQVFGRGDNEGCKLGLPSDIEEVEEFTLIESLSKYHVIEASAGTVDSLFRTREGQILGCGWNDSGELMLKSGNKEEVYPPEETKVTSGATFCISGAGSSVVFVGVEPPPNSPNMKIRGAVH